MLIRCSHRSDDAQLLCERNFGATVRCKCNTLPESENSAEKINSCLSPPGIEELSINHTNNKMKISSIIVAAAGLASCTDAYKITSYKEKNCKGPVQQTIKNTIYGAICLTLKTGAASIKIENSGGKKYQWIFFNQKTCSSKSQVGSFLGDNCITQGGTPLQAISNVVVDGSKRDLESGEEDEEMGYYQAEDLAEAEDVAEEEHSLEKRSNAGIITTWKNNDCSGGFTNQEVFPVQNQQVDLNSVGSARVTGVRKQDTAYICSDKNCAANKQIQKMKNGVCVKNLKSKNVNSAIVIGVPPPPPPKRNLIAEAQEHARDFSVVKRDNIECSKTNLADFKDALKSGDAFDGQPLACCCHRPGQHTSKAVGTARTTISDNIACPVDPTGTKPPPSACPLICADLRSYVYAVANKCKNKNGKTGGVYHLPAKQTITVSHS